MMGPTAAIAPAVPLGTAAAGLSLEPFLQRTKARVSRMPKHASQHVMMVRRHASPPCGEVASRRCPARWRC